MFLSLLASFFSLFIKFVLRCIQSVVLFQRAHISNTSRLECTASYANVAIQISLEFHFITSRTAGGVVKVFEAIIGYGATGCSFRRCLSSRLFLLNFHEAKHWLETLLAELDKSFTHESFIENIKQQRQRKAITKRELSAAHFTFQHYHHHSKTRSDHIEKL